MANGKRLLIVDDDKIHRIIYSTIAQKMDYAVDLAGSVSEAESALKSRAYDCIVLDLILGDEWGRDVVDLLATLEKKPPVMLVSGAHEQLLAETLRHGRDLGVHMFEPVRKPVNMALIRSLLHSIDAHGLAREHAQIVQA